MSKKYQKINVPYGAIADAKKLKQWRTGNVCFGDSYFAMDCRKRWGDEIFNEACKQVEYIPIDDIR